MRKVRVIVRRNDRRPEWHANFGQPRRADLPVDVIVCDAIRAYANNGHIDGPPTAAQSQPVVVFLN